MFKEEKNTNPKGKENRSKNKNKKQLNQK